MPQVDSVASFDQMVHDFVQFIIGELVGTHLYNIFTAFIVIP